MPYREPQDGDYLACPKCTKTVEVSTEDPDASLSEMVRHLRWFHQASEREALTSLKLLDATGKEVQS